MIRHFYTLLGLLENPITHKSAESAPLRQAPVIWLLGKTGAGKSTLIRALTGLSDIEVGNGFSPCTSTAQQFNFPNEEPVVTFLDTRGLGETAYDPAEDLAFCEQASHKVFVVARLDDPVQQEIATVIRKLKKTAKTLPLTVIHTGADLLSLEDARRAQANNQMLFEAAAKQSLAHYRTAIAPDFESLKGLDQLLQHIADTLPEVALLLAYEHQDQEEAQHFSQLRALIIRHAMAASAADLAPGIGALTVPATQAFMLRSVAKHYNLRWTKPYFAQFSAALGTALLLRFGGQYAVRQATKLIPIYGQSIGAISAGAMSFASTYALGRAAAYYLYAIHHQLPIDANQLRDLYKKALSESTSRFNQPHSKQ